ncbi:STAS/SEC14 domain-containing protein [uncultured Sulfitobacter sp.]|uniref:STAS/SEC14 domain-containing protein n=1 Tax=uncultured Sulfitobacter sp. TaxID=191468 RepID=UPI00261864CB|nr:STAS/SEC14 domain-containing protein [uncultured Sulfitobacter sp.]
MLNVSKPKANRLNIELSGVLDAAEMQAALDGIVRESEGFSNGTMLYTISDFEMPTLGAMAVEFYRMPKLFSLLDRFNKCAVLCDTAWIRTAAQIEGAIIPSLAIKSFALDQASAAEAWLGDEDNANDEEDDFENFPV